MTSAELLIRELVSKALPAMQSTKLREAVTDFLVTGEWEPVRSNSYLIFYRDELDKAVDYALRCLDIISSPERSNAYTTRMFRLACRDLKRRLPRS